MPGRTGAFVLVLLAVAGLSGGVASQHTPQASQPALQESKDWKRLTTRSLVVVGNARPEELRRAGREIERFRESLRMLSPGLLLDSPVPTHVVVFRNDKAMRQFKPRMLGRILDAVAAYFGPHPDVNYIVMSASGPSEFRHRVIYHEYTHFIVSRNVKRLPVWLNEGLADFYGTFAAYEDGRAVIGRPIPQYVLLLVAGASPPLEWVIDPQNMSRAARDRHRTTSFYAHAWALTHYLMLGEGGTLRPLLSRYVALLQTGRPFAAAFHEVFGDLEKLQRAMRQHITQPQLPALAVPDVAVESDLPVVPMLELDALRLQGDLLVRVNELDDGDKLIARVLERDPQHVPARLSRARSLIARGQPAGAVDVLSAPDLATLPVFGVQLLRGDAFRLQERYDEAIAAYRRASELQPDSPWPFYGISLAQTALKDPGATANFARCLALHPNPEWYGQRLFDLLSLGVDTYAVTDATNYVRTGGWQGNKTAWVLINAAITLLRRPEHRSEALEMLAEVDRQIDPDSWPARVSAFLQGG
ncbi:MAG TPA: tetratricopeptide repeat protein [Vicinamibacterales bacterium]